MTSQDICYLDKAAARHSFDHNTIVNTRETTFSKTGQICAAKNKTNRILS